MSASVSKIPVAKHRRLSPERPSPAVSPQKSVSKLPIKVSKIGNISDVSVQRQFKENICDNSSRWSETSSPMTSPSRIPVMKSQPDVSEVVTPRHHDVTPRHHDVTPRHHDVTPRHHDVTPHQQRPQSIDLEDEYISGRSYILSSSSHPPEIVPHQVRKMSDPKIGFSPQRKISPMAAQTTNSRIPIASEYYSRTGITPIFIQLPSRIIYNYLYCCINVIPLKSHEEASNALTAIVFNHLFFIKSRSTQTFTSSQHE